MLTEETLQRNVPLAPYTTFGIGGTADYFVIASDRDTLIQAITFARKKHLPLFILGCGANILIGDKGFRGLVIKNEAKEIKKSPPVEGEGGGLLSIGSGTIVADLITQTQEQGLSGLEHFAGIPSTIGGAIWQNLHFLSPERDRTVFISEIITGGEVFTKDNQIKTVDNAYFKFGYDTSSIHTNGDIVLSVTLCLLSLDPQIIKQRMEANLKWRREKHHEWATTKSAGSIFKKIEGVGAGRLIDKVGLKGHRIGGAEISPHHANFIMNTGGATAQNVMDIIHLVQKKVKEETGFLLEPEITFVGEF